jgi:hypothetical protein
VPALSYTIHTKNPGAKQVINFKGKNETSVISLNLCNSFYLWVLHPVVHLYNWFPMMPSITTKFQYVNSLLFSFSLDVLAPTGHLQVRYTIRYS